MKSSTRPRSARSAASVVWGVSMMFVSVTFGSASLARADVLVRLVTGREILVREHWFAGSQVWFTRERGAVGVPRELVAAIEAVDAQGRGIGAGPRPVNAAPLVAPEPIR